MPLSKSVGGVVVRGPGIPVPYGKNDTTAGAITRVMRTLFITNLCLNNNLDVVEGQGLY